MILSIYLSGCVFLKSKARYCLYIKLKFTKYICCSESWPEGSSRPGKKRKTDMKLSFSIVSTNLLNVPQYFRIHSFDGAIFEPYKIIMENIWQPNVCLQLHAWALYCLGKINCDIQWKYILLLANIWFMLLTFSPADHIPSPNIYLKRCLRSLVAIANYCASPTCYIIQIEHSRKGAL